MSKVQIKINELHIHLSSGGQMADALVKAALQLHAEDADTEEETASDENDQARTPVQIFVSVHSGSAEENAEAIEKVTTTTAAGPADARQTQP